MIRALVCVEGVLFRDDALSSAVNPDARVLLKGLSSTYGIVYLTLAEDEEAVRKRIKQENFPTPIRRVVVPTGGLISRKEQLAACRIPGAAEIFVTASPEDALAAQQLGIPFLFYRDLRPTQQWGLPTRHTRPWHEIIGAPPPPAELPNLEEDVV